MAPLLVVPFSMKHCADSAIAHARCCAWSAFELLPRLTLCVLCAQCTPHDVHTLLIPVGADAGTYVQPCLHCHCTACARPIVESMFLPSRVGPQGFNRLSRSCGSQRRMSMSPLRCLNHERRERGRSEQILLLDIMVGAPPLYLFYLSDRLRARSCCRSTSDLPRGTRRVTVSCFTGHHRARSLLRPNAKVLRHVFSAVDER